MSNQRGTFAKRQREMELKDRARAKDERRAQRAQNPRVGKGPEIAWNEAVTAVTTPDNQAADVSLVPTDDTAD